MGNTIYATFADPSFAEKAAGALLDFGVREEDISVVRNYNADEHPNKNLNTSTSGLDCTNRQLDDDLALESANRYGTTGDTETWTGPESAANADAYTGLVYNSDVDPTRTRVVNNPLTTNYGDTSTRVDRFDDDRFNPYPLDHPSESFDDRSGADYERAAKQGISTTTGADAGAGAAKGAGWGLGLGIIAGLASLTVPGVGLVIGGGALASGIGAAAAAAAGGAIAGGVVGYLKDQGMEEHVATDYNSAISHGAAMIAVTIPSGNVDEARVRQILDKYGAANLIQYATHGYVA